MPSPSLLPSHRSRACNSDGGESVARFKSIADSSQDAAKLLLQVRRIAIDELIHDVVCAPVTPVQRPKPAMCVLPNLSLSRTVSPSGGRSIDTATPNTRFRAVSIGCFQDCEESATKETLLQGLAEVVELDTQSRTRPTGKLEEWYSKFCFKNLDDEEESPDESHCFQESPHDIASPYSIKFVGDTLPSGFRVRSILRKKFSWKSFPELEAYLVDHRPKYLECSNALNYTKAQKFYNNQLTQGLLDLAAKEGYVFEGFTFAAVRDRIRCFYKSFVQATKKKKRMKVQGRIRSLTM